MFVHISKKMVDKIVVEVGGRPSVPHAVEVKSDLNYAMSEWGQAIRNLIEPAKMYTVNEMVALIQNAVDISGAENVIVRSVPIL